MGTGSSPVDRTKAKRLCDSAESFRFLIMAGDLHLTTGTICLPYSARLRCRQSTMPSPHPFAALPVQKDPEHSVHADAVFGQLLKHLKLPDLRIRQLSPLPPGQISQGDRSEFNTFQTDYLMTDRLQHFSDLSVSALMD